MALLSLRPQKFAYRHIGINEEEIRMSKNDVTSNDTVFILSFTKIHQ